MAEITAQRRETQREIQWCQWPRCPRHPEKRKAGNPVGFPTGFPNETITWLGGLSGAAPRCRASATAGPDRSGTPRPVPPSESEDALCLHAVEHGQPRVLAVEIRAQRGRRGVCVWAAGQTWPAMSRISTTQLSIRCSTVRFICSVCCSLLPAVQFRARISDPP